MGLQAIPMRADGGPIGGDYTHEFLVLAETGESEVFYDSAITDQSFGDRAVDYDKRARMPGGAGGVHLALLPARMKPTTKPHLTSKSPKTAGALRAGLRWGKSSISAPSIPKPWAPPLVTPDGSRVPVHMGSHGIGVSAPAGAIIEAKPLMTKASSWPEGVTPFHCGIVNLKAGR